MQLNPAKPWHSMPETGSPSARSRCSPVPWRWAHKVAAVGRGSRGRCSQVRAWRAMRRAPGFVLRRKKLAEGKTHREALRALKRQVSNAVFTRLRIDARRTQAQARDPGGQ